jgi:hypothetical protein
VRPGLDVGDVRQGPRGATVGDDTILPAARPTALPRSTVNYRETYGLHAPTAFCSTTRARSAARRSSPEARGRRTPRCTPGPGTRDADRPMPRSFRVSRLPDGRLQASYRAHPRRRPPG